MKKDLLSGLDPKQAEAVRLCDAHELVIAGAGSGKTRVLTSKIAYLIGEIGVRPYRIAALTFTNKAAREMESRVHALIGEDLRGMQVSTFHSFGLRFLHRRSAEMEKLGWPSSFVIADRGDAKTIVKRAARKLGLDGTDVSAMVERISRAKAEADPFDLEPNIEERYRSIYEEYQASLHESGAIDFDDLMVLPLHMMTTMPHVMEEERARIDWILVDEYQDVNAPQYALLRALRGDRARVMVVGDPDQSIYGWRGADMSLIMRFEEDHPGANVVVLDQNYRSTGHILGAANEVIARNADRVKKDLWTAAGPGKKVSVLMARSDMEESSSIVDEIDRAIDEGYRYGDIAILYRMNALSRGFEQALLERAIPHRVVRGVAFYDRREVKDVISMMRLAFNPKDAASLERVANVPTRGIGKKGVETLASFLSLAAGTPEQIWDELASSPPLKGRARDGVLALCAAMSDIVRASDLSEAIDLILHRHGYREFLMDEYQDDLEDRLENIQEILSVAPKEGSIPEIMSEIALFTDAESSDGSDDAVSLLTLHAAKGLEFPIVFIVGFEEGIFPSSRSAMEIGGMEEERRLCYVGMTRARERLYLSGVASRLIFGTFQRSPISRFLREIPSEHADVDDRTGGVARGKDADRGANRRRWGW